MTNKKGYESTLIELRKHKSPSLHIEEYNYFMNKGIQEYANERYALFESTQQLSDDLQPLMSGTTATLVVSATGIVANYSGSFTELSVPVTTGKRYGSDFYKFKAPDNYWHMTGSHVTNYTKFNYKCHPAGYQDNRPSKRLPVNIANGIINNAYLKPNFNRPYHGFSDGSGKNVKPDLTYYIGDINRFGISDVFIDYLKEPTKVELTISQRDLPIDSSEILEFPEATCNEIVKRVVKLILEASSDPRLNTHIPVNKTI